MEQFLKIFFNCLLLACLSFSQTKSQIMDPEVQKIVEDGINEINTEQNILSKKTVPQQGSEYDFIIVGASPGGCVLSNRLSKNPKTSVFLLEAGGTENFLSQMPAFAAVLQRTKANWQYKSTPQKNACRGMYNNSCGMARGKMLGGSSSIGFMMYTRGNKLDFDGWANAGNTGWSYDEVLPYFIRSENIGEPCLKDSIYRGTQGPQRVECDQYRTETAKAFVESAQLAGENYVDYNGKTQLGVSFIQANTINGHRQSAAKAYLDPILGKRDNLHVLTHATVTKVLIDPTTLTAYGVTFLHGGTEYTIKAKKEVILTAGAINSAQLLMLSGVGPSNILNKINVPLLKELPVCQTFYDQTTTLGPIFTVNATGSTLFSTRITPEDVKEYSNGNPATRISTLLGAEALVFAKTSNSKTPKDVPDVEPFIVTTTLAGDYGTFIREAANFRQDVYDSYNKPLENVEHFTFLMNQVHPASIGSCWLESSDPLTPPIINPNYFDDPEDVEIMLGGIRESIRLCDTPAMKKINTTLYSKKVLGCEEFEFGSDDYWRCYIKTFHYPLHNHVATCKMGPASDPTAVVDPELKVHGIKNLRVADAGVIPKPVSGQPYAAAIMIGEKAADLIMKPNNLLDILFEIGAISLVLNIFG